MIALRQNEAVRADYEALRAANEKHLAKVRELEALLHRPWANRSFRLVHGIAKTLRIDRE